MEVTLARLGPVVKALVKIGRTLERLADLKEMEMRAEGTYKVAAPPSGSPKTTREDEVEVSYSDPELEAFIEQLRKSGQDEVADRMKALAENEIAPG